MFAFTTIEVVPGLTPWQRRKTVAVAPRAVGSRRPYADLLESAGFVDIRVRDLSKEFLISINAWLAHTTPVRDEVAAIDGAEAVDERLAEWAEAAIAIERRWLTRAMYTARRP